MAETAQNGGFRKNPLICSLLDPSKCILILVTRIWSNNSFQIKS